MTGNTVRLPLASAFAFVGTWGRWQSREGARPVHFVAFASSLSKRVLVRADYPLMTCGDSRGWRKIYGRRQRLASMA